MTPEPSFADLRRAADARAAGLARRFGDALIVGERYAAERVADDALASGMTPVAVQSLVIGPAMVRIGELWEAGVIGVADEHLATSISHLVMIRLFEALSDGRVRPRSGQRVLLAAVAGQHHVLGLRMIADALEGAGFEVIYLGADVPADSLGSVVARHQPAVAGLSYGLAGDARPLADAIATVHETDPEIRIMLGGRAVPRLLRTSDYAYAADSLEVVDVVDALLAGGRQAVPAVVDRLRSVGSPALVPVVEDDSRDAIAAALGRSAEQAVDIAREHVRRADAYRQPELRDPLTGLGNRRAFEDDVGALSAGTGGGGALLIVDVDGLRTFNRERGPQAGDRLLRSVGRAIAGAVRPQDVAARFGGDEFAVALPGGGPQLGAATAAAIRAAVADLADAVTVSVGVARLSADVRGSLLAADTALYAAKASGGDRVVAAPEDHPSAGSMRG